MKRWRLTPFAEERLADISEWTARRFGEAKAISYQEALIDRLNALAQGKLPRARPCDVLMPRGRAETGLSYYREGGHFIIFRETAVLIEVLDFLHENADLPAHIERLKDG